MAVEPVAVVLTVVGASSSAARGEGRDACRRRPQRRRPTCSEPRRASGVGAETVRRAERPALSCSPPRQVPRAYSRPRGDSRETRQEAQPLLGRGSLPFPPAQTRRSRTRRAQSAAALRDELPEARVLAMGSRSRSSRASSTKGSCASSASFRCPSASSLRPSRLSQQAML